MYCKNWGERTKGDTLIENRSVVYKNSVQQKKYMYKNNSAPNIHIQPSLEPSIQHIVDMASLSAVTYNLTGYGEKKLLALDLTTLRKMITERNIKTKSKS